MRVAELADAANLSQSRLTHRLKTMIERGLVEITAEHDREHAGHIQEWRRREGL